MTCALFGARAEVGVYGLWRGSDVDESPAFFYFLVLAFTFSVFSENGAILIEKARNVSKIIRIR